MRYIIFSPDQIITSLHPSPIPFSSPHSTLLANIPRSSCAVSNRSTGGLTTFSAPSISVPLLNSPAPEPIPGAAVYNFSPPSSLLVSTAGGVKTSTLSNVIILAFLACFLPSPSTLRLNGYAIPPFVGRVLDPSVAGISVAGDCGWSDTTMLGDESPWLSSSVGEGSVEAWRSGAI
jgi:hypothetical protein